MRASACKGGWLLSLGTSEPEEEHFSAAHPPKKHARTPARSKVTGESFSLDCSELRPCCVEGRAWLAIIGANMCSAVIFCL